MIRLKVVAALALSMTACSCVIAGTLEAAVGTAAVTGATKLATIIAASGPSDTPMIANPSAGQGEGDSRQMAAAAKDYLEQLFAGQPEALVRVQTAWQNEMSKPAAASRSWGLTTESNTQLRSATSARSSSSSSGSDALDSNSGGASCGVCKALNTLYEADLPQFHSRMEELVVSRGYPLERHAVVTPDGFELILFRIPHGKNSAGDPSKRPPVLLQHGITLSSDAFVLYDSSESLGFILADAGFDVWIANQRGNTYSRRNVNGIYPYQPQFWYFSIDTLAQLDLPTQVDYVLQATGARKIGYLGHSQGCMLVNLLCASKPEYNAKFTVLAEMAPVFFVQNIKQPYLRLGATLHFDELLYLLRVGEFLPNRLTAPLLSTLCAGWPLDEVCAAAVAFFFFGPSQRVQPQDYTDIARTWPSSVGSRNMVHWSQNVRAADGEFRYYNWGNTCNNTSRGLLRGLTGRPFFESCNQRQYGTAQPPAYDLSRVTAPTVHFLAERDLLSTSPDIAEQQRRLGGALHGQFIYPDYAHMDFIWDRKMKATPDIIDTLRKFSTDA